MDEIELLRHWHHRVRRMQKCHYEAAMHFDRLHLLLGIPVVVLATVVGASVMAELDAKIIVGLLSMSAAVLAGLQTFLKYSDLAEKHRSAGARYAALKLELERLISFSSQDADTVSDAVKDLESRWAALSEESATVPAKIRNRIYEKMEYERSTKVASNNRLEKDAR